MRLLLCAAALLALQLLVPGAGAAGAAAALPEGFDPYAALRAPRGASALELKAAYRRALNVLGRRAARGGHGQVTEDGDYSLMVAVRQAYELLSDAPARAAWDAAHPAPPAATPVPQWRMEDDEDDL
jgi:preprotein translocase subunit Sec63